MATRKSNHCMFFFIISLQIVSVTGSQSEEDTLHDHCHISHISQCNSSSSANITGNLPRREVEFLPDAADFLECMRRGTELYRLRMVTGEPNLGISIQDPMNQITYGFEQPFPLGSCKVSSSGASIIGLSKFNMTRIDPDWEKAEIFYNLFYESVRGVGPMNIRTTFMELPFTYRDNFTMIAKEADVGIICKYRFLKDGTVKIYSVDVSVNVKGTVTLSLDHQITISNEIFNSFVSAKTIFNGFRETLEKTFEDSLYKHLNDVLLRYNGKGKQFCG